jgi:hypothetical protein
MEASPKSLYEVFSAATRFIIPEFQRPYVWSKEQVDQLWNDLEGAYSDNITADELEEYFLGPLVIAMQQDHKGSTVAHVIDGQQRITTIQTMLWIFNNRLKLLSNEECKEGSEFLNRILLTTSQVSLLSVAAADSHNFNAVQNGVNLDESTRLGAAASDLRKMIDKYPEDKILGFIYFICNRTRFIFVRTDSYINAWELFIGLNGKGKPLNPADLIKAYICGTAGDSKAVADVWVTNILPLEDDATSAIQDVCRVATGNKVIETKLFKVFEDNWNKSVTIDSLGQGCIIYDKFWKKDLTKLDDLTEADRKHIRNLRNLGRRDISPIILALANRFGYKIIFTSTLIGLLDAYQLWMAICSKWSKDQSFAKLGYQIVNSTCEFAECLVSIAEEIDRIKPSKDQVLASIQESAYPGKTLFQILKSYEEGMRGEVQVDNIWYEHIMPKTGTAFWFNIAGTRNTNEYARIVNNIGNIAPLDRSTNIQGSNDEWPLKRELYMKNVPNWLIAGIARDNADEWDKKKMIARATKIAEWCVNTRWPLDILIRKIVDQ